MRLLMLFKNNQVSWMMIEKSYSGRYEFRNLLLIKQIEIEQNSFGSHYLYIIIRKDGCAVLSQKRLKLVIIENKCNNG